MEIGAQAWVVWHGGEVCCPWGKLQRSRLKFALGRQARKAYDAPHQASHNMAVLTCSGIS
jgi:hypothetical protein